MAVTKYMKRIVAPTDLELNERDENNADRKAEALHDHTYGITSDPLTRFACVFAALIHDLDHPGVPNTRFAVENKTLAARYQGRSIAEQNSLDIA